MAYKASDETAFSQDDVDTALRVVARQKENGLSETPPYHESVGQPFIKEMQRLGFKVKRVRVEGDKKMPCVDLCNSYVFYW